MYIIYVPTKGADSVTKKLGSVGATVTLKTSGMSSAGGTAINLLIKDSSGGILYNTTVYNNKENNVSYTIK